MDLLAYADEWRASWNAHDLERLLQRFDDSVVFKSPAAAKLVPGSSGTVIGKTALRAYWSEGLRLIPNLHFEVLAVYEGVDCMTINFVNQDGREANEVLIFHRAMIVQGFGTYRIDPSRMASI
ncbi:nuclear transport factor 2 family protein [Sphingomonas sp. QA11]|uniref:nuclear transport factor 2 family protein n=1 Tax=Sphingomonas sp. QA11 TaxID=2950605 RepID=UPI0023492E0A|nr:nuclear transport factor 2 family protein [Sphingomonas sp. QA11]WCM27397.1 nuclear transport factor 2 family protein [Sphingomonas sp. QA11]